jgi:signal transduction histidine kinase/CheY-like chemotaxis protein
MILDMLRRFGPIPFAALSGTVIVLCSIILVGGLDLLLKDRIIPLDLLIGGLTAVAIGPISMYLPFQMARRIETLRDELDRANQRLRSEAETLQQRSTVLARANRDLGFSQRVARVAYYQIDLRSGAITGSPELFTLFPLGAEHPPTLAGWRDQVHPAFRDTYDAVFERCVRGAAAIKLDLRLADDSDSERWLHLYGEFWPDEAAGFPGTIVGIVQDISELRRAETLRLANERLISENAALAQADRMKDEFLATMSHELRTPLTGVLSLSEALLEEVYGPLNESQQHKLQIIESSGQHLLKLINDILDLAKIRSGKADVGLEDISLCEVARPALATVQRLALDKGLALVPPTEDCRYVVHVDPLRLKQILLNLLSNAIKFTAPGGRIGLEFEHDPGTEWVRCVVWDTGIGMTEQDLGNLFQPFFQVESTLSRRFGGTGLGLCLAQRLAELQGGRITVTSEPGAGSRFTVHLPLVTTTDDTGAKPFSSGAIPDQRQNGKVLLVEDNAVNSAVCREYLERKGLDVIEAADGRIALARAASERPDVIVMDIQMPVMDGLDAIRQLRASDDPELAATPIVVLSALAMAGDEQRCRDAGCDVFLAKPTRLDQLHRTLAEYLQRPPGLKAQAAEAEADAG